MRVVGLVILFVLFCSPAYAATVFGTVFDSTLKQTENVKLSINTTPAQQLIAVNGRYTFTVRPGHYTISAEQLEFGRIIARATEEVIIENDGSFILDVILFSTIDQELVDETEAITVDDLNEPKLTDLVPVLLIIIIIILGLILWRMKHLLKRVHATYNESKEVPREKEEVNIMLNGEHDEIKKEKIEELSDKNEVNVKNLPKDLQEIVDFLKQQENRTTQKEIRKQFPKSEAKVSLLLADLEKRGLIEKIKKGRGNIVILITSPVKKE